MCVYGSLRIVQILSKRMVFLVFFRYENTRIWLDFNYQMQNAKYEMQIRVQHTQTHTRSAIGMKMCFGRREKIHKNKWNV